MKRKIKNKKGSMLDFFLIPVILLVAVLFLVTSLVIANKVVNIDVFTDNTDANNVVNLSRNSLLNMDNMVLFMIVGLSLFTLVASYFVWNHPAFFFIGVIFLIIAVLFSAMISNTYETFSSQPTLSNATSLIPKVSFIMGKLPFYLVFMGFAAIIVMYIGYQKQNI